MIGFTKALFFIIFYSMKNTHKDRYQNKLHRFLKEWNSNLTCNIASWHKYRSDLMKKYGFTDEDWHKAIRLTESGQDSRHFWKHTNCRNDKTPKEWKYDDHCDYEEKDIDNV